MAFRAFTQMHVYEKQTTPKDKDKSSIHCLECFDRNVYIGTKDGMVQHLILPSSTNEDLSPGQSKAREGRARKLGSSNQVAQLRTVPLFNHLLVLWDRSVTALNMFSLEPVPALKKIQHVSLFEVCNSLLKAQTACVQMVTSSSRRKVIQIHVVGVDRWDAIKEVQLLQEPVALAVDDFSLCVATSDRYLLCDIQTGSSEDLFPHNHSKQGVVVTSVGQGEFLLNGPESLGKSCQMFMVHVLQAASAEISICHYMLLFQRSVPVNHLIHLARGYLFFVNKISPSSPLRRVCDEDGDLPACAPAMASGGAGSRRVFPLHLNPAAPSAVCL